MRAPQSSIYLRVQREGRWVNLRIEELTENELVAAMAGRSHDELVRWIGVLCALQRLEPPASIPER